MAKLRSTEDYSIWDESVPDTYEDPATGGAPTPNPPEAPPSQPDDVYAQAKSLYGKNWDADAQQQLDYRLSKGQSVDEILGHTKEDATARYNGAREQGARMQGSAGGGFVGGGGQGGGNADLMNALKGLWGGQANQGIIDSRVSNARDTLERQRKSQGATDKAVLASRGLLGSGPEATAMFRNDQNIADQFQNAVTGIYADESANADQRMMQALSLAAGLSEGDANRAVEWFRANTDRTNVGNQYNLGLGNLALGNSKLANDYNLGLADFGLRRDQYLNDADNADLSQLMALIEQLMRGAGTSAGGYY